MALSPTEEAQTRDLIAQQAALLSLAGVEATILSKLGATKVTLSDLPSASVINDADLLLLRQGVTDKSVTGLTFKGLIPTIADASETVKGVVELATSAEVIAGTDTVRAITSAGLQSKVASETALGIVELATDAESQTATDRTRALCPANLNATVLGMGQTWQTVTGSRAVATNYTNTTGRPIAVSVMTSSAAVSTNSQLLVDGVLVAQMNSASANALVSLLFAIVPNGAVYRLNVTSAAINAWAELR